MTLRLRGDFDPLVVTRLYRLIRGRRIQLVCGNMDKEVRQAGLAARLAGVPLIRRRGTDMPYPNKLRHRLVNRHLVRLIIVNSRAIRETLLRGNPWLSSAKIRLIYNGFPEPPEVTPSGRGEVLREFDLLGASPVLGHVGLLKERKGHEVLFRALPELLSQFPRLALLVVGEGELRESLEELAEGMGIRGSIRFTGFRDDISRLMGATDLLVLPTHNEGFPWVLAEAMSLGKPVVASRVGGIPELVQDGRTGLLVPCGDETALGMAIAELVRQPGRAAQMGLAGRRWIQERFGVEKMLNQLEKLFTQVIRERRLGRAS